MENIFYPKFFSLKKKGLLFNQWSTDVFSGIIVGIVALPLAIAFAVASGVSPEKGLITAVIAGFIISFLGGSRVQIGGPTGAFIVIVYGILQQYGPGGLMISTIIAGALLIAFGLLRLGSLLKFIPHPLIVGFTSGIALVIFTTQMKDAFGLSIDSMPSEFIGKWNTYFHSLSTFNPWAIGITIATILIVVFSKKITTKIPGSFIAILLITLLVRFFHLPVTTIETLFGEISGKITFEFPGINLSEIPHYFAPALTIALLGGIESLLSAVVSDGMISSTHRSNTELIAQGIANVVSPLFGGIPATGAIARTVTNIKNGGRTPISGIVHAVTLFLIMIFFGKWAKLIPMPCLAGILIVVAYNMSEWRSFRSILKGSFFDIIILLSTFFLTVLVDLTVAIEVGVILSALLFMKRMADMGLNLPENVDNDLMDKYEQLPQGISVYEISGPLFFGSAKSYAEIIKQVGLKTNIIILRMRHVPFIDSTGCKNLGSVTDILKSNQTRVMLSGVNPNVMDELEKWGITQKVGKENIYDLFDNALKDAVNCQQTKINCGNETVS
ncbi:MAG: SulP family inorganic anion transporter [Prolixibacteraceae bacterium]|nr:SulP family inorganic anion transporter [Prolixibacteraceae bacterium]